MPSLLMPPAFWRCIGLSVITSLKIILFLAFGLQLQPQKQFKSREFILTKLGRNRIAAKLQMRRVARIKWAKKGTNGYLCKACFQFGFVESTGYKNCVDILDSSWSVQFVLQMERLLTEKLFDVC